MMDERFVTDDFIDDDVIPDTPSPVFRRSAGPTNNSKRARMNKTSSNSIISISSEDDSFSCKNNSSLSKGGNFKNIKPFANDIVNGNNPPLSLPGQPTFSAERAQAIQRKKLNDKLSPFKSPKLQGFVKSSSLMKSPLQSGDFEKRLNGSLSNVTHKRKSETSGSREVSHGSKQRKGIHYTWPSSSESSSDDDDLLASFSMKRLKTTAGCDRKQLKSASSTHVSPPVLGSAPDWSPTRMKSSCKFSNSSYKSPEKSSKSKFTAYPSTSCNISPNKSKLSTFTSKLSDRSGLSACTNKLSDRAGLSTCTNKLSDRAGLSTCTNKLSDRSGLSTCTNKLSDRPGLSACTSKVPDRSGLSTCTSKLTDRPGFSTFTSKLSEKSGKPKSPCMYTYKDKASPSKSDKWGSFAELDKGAHRSHPMFGNLSSAGLIKDSKSPSEHGVAYSKVESKASNSNIRNGMKKKSKISETRVSPEVQGVIVTTNSSDRITSDTSLGNTDNPIDVEHLPCTPNTKLALNNIDQMDKDEEIARQLQEELDHEFAMALQNDSTDGATGHAHHDYCPQVHGSVGPAHLGEEHHSGTGHTHWHMYSPVRSRRGGRRRGAGRSRDNQMSDELLELMQSYESNFNELMTSPPRRGRRRGHQGHHGNLIAGVFYSATDPGNDYESLMNLAEMLGEVKEKGLTKSELNRLPIVTYKRPEGTVVEDAECNICMMNYEDGDVQKILPCFHTYHSQCIDQWIKKNRTCPVCRVEIKLE